MPINVGEIQELEEQDVLNVGRIKLNENLELIRLYINAMELAEVNGGDAEGL